MQFVLGAADPEMAKIEELLISAGQPVRHAIRRGRRVTPKHAYSAERPSGLIDWDQQVVWVESSIDELRQPHHLSADHHRAGDFGYSLGPEQYLEASSIGQVCKLIDVPPTEDIRYTAAADHCLAAAYAGLCPNIDPERMRLWRGRSRAQFKKMALAQFEKSLQETINQLRDRPTITIGGFKFIDAMDSEYRELVDASAIIGLGAMFSYFDRRKNRFKVAAINGAPAAMAAWIEWSKQQPYFEDQWGDPQRGFAGAYVIPTDRPNSEIIQQRQLHAPATRIQQPNSSP